MIVDSHVHFWDLACPQGIGWPPPSRTDLYRTFLPGDLVGDANAQMPGQVVLVEAVARDMDDNLWLLDLAGRTPCIAGVVGALDIRSDAFEADLQVLAGNPLLKGLRVDSADKLRASPGRTDKALSVLADAALALDLLVRPADLADVAWLAERHAGLRLVVDHLGQPAIAGNLIDAQWRAAMERLAAQPNVFVKVSAMPEQTRRRPAPTELDVYQPMFETVLALFGPHRLLFGSNWPVCREAMSYTQVVSLARRLVSPLPGTEAAAVLGGSARRVYGLSGHQS